MNQVMNSRHFHFGDRFPIFFLSNLGVFLILMHYNYILFHYLFLQTVTSSLKSSSQNHLPLHLIPSCNLCFILTLLQFCISFKITSKTCFDRNIFIYQDKNVNKLLVARRLLKYFILATSYVKYLVMHLFNKSEQKKRTNYMKPIFEHVTQNIYLLLIFVLKNCHIAQLQLNND